MRRKGWTIFSQDDFEDYNIDEPCSDKQRKECVKDDCCYMVCGTGGGYINKNHIPNPNARQRAVVKSDMLDCRKVQLMQSGNNADKTILIMGETVNDNSMRIIGKVMKELKSACICPDNSKKISTECITCNALELLKIWVEHKFDFFDEASDELGIDESDLLAGMR